jgi:hypothetical protein
MTRGVEASLEILVADLGDVTVTLRPEIPFLAEGVRLLERRRLEIFGERRKIVVDVPEEAVAALSAVEQVLLVEFRDSGASAFRELILPVER